jgi:hypothetical protein
MISVEIFFMFFYHLPTTICSLPVSMRSPLLSASGEEREEQLFLAYGKEQFFQVRYVVLQIGQLIYIVSP